MIKEPLYGIIKKLKELEDKLKSNYKTYICRIDYHDVKLYNR